MDLDLTAIIIAIIGSGVVNTMITQIIAIKEKKNKNESGMQHAIRLVMKDRLRFLCVRYIEQGWIYEDELEDLITMHCCYHDLGGNGFLNEMMEKVSNLEIRGVGVK